MVIEVKMKIVLFSDVFLRRIVPPAWIRTGVAMMGRATVLTELIPCRICLDTCTRLNTIANGQASKTNDGLQPIRMVHPDDGIKHWRNAGLVSGQGGHVPSCFQREDF